MLQMPITPREIFCFPRQGLGWEVTGSKKFIKLYNKKNIKKSFYHPSTKKVFFSVHNINMLNKSQHNETKHINKEISLLQNRLKINGKSLNQFQNGLMQIGRIRVKQGQRTNLFQTKKIQKILKDIFKNKIQHIKKKADLLKNALVNVKKQERDYLKKD